MIITNDSFIKSSSFFCLTATLFVCRSVWLLQPEIFRFYSNDSQSFPEIKAESQASFGNVAPGCLFSRLLKCDYVHDVRPTRGIYTETH